jgi:threonine/homoserine/homoserine lactone efflux protein
MLSTALQMDPGLLATFMGMALFLYFTPGADMMFTIASGVAGGPRAGLAVACGVSLGVLAHAGLAAAGLAAAVAAEPRLLDAIRWAGAAYLLYLAWQSWRATEPPATLDGPGGMGRALRRGFVTNLLNPKVGLFVLAFLPQFADPAIGPVWHQIVILGLLLALGAVVTDGAYGVFAGGLANHVRRSARLMNRIAAVIFGGIAVRLLVT